MITFFILMPIAALFMAVNIIAACFVAIQLGYGPPDWRTALNLVVRLTTLQDTLNAARDWVDTKAPWADKMLQRLHCPKPIVIIVPIREESDISDDSYEAEISRIAASPVEKLLEDAAPAPPRPDAEPAVYDDDVVSALMNGNTEAWLVNDKYIETALMRLNSVLMKSGQFAASIDQHIRAAAGKITEADIKRFVEDVKADIQNMLTSQKEIAAKIAARIEEFGDYKPLAEEITKANAERQSQAEAIVKDLKTLAGRAPEEEAQQLLMHLSALRTARHQLRDIHEKVFSLAATKEQRLNLIPRQLFVDDISGQRGRLGLTVTLCDWWNKKRQENRQLAAALLDFVQFGNVNDQHGITVGDKIIKQFAAVLKEKFDSPNLFGIYAGNVFFVMTMNDGYQATAANIERLRQGQTKTIYNISEKGNPIQVLLTCAVTEVLPEQSIDDVFSALDTALAAAKAAGKNITYCLPAGASKPEKMDAPDFNKPEQTVTL